MMGLLTQYLASALDEFKKPRLSPARRIADEEEARAFRISRGRAWNNRYDAERHARWAYRMAKEIDPVTAYLVSVGHEVTGLLKGEPLREARMDMNNNWVGLDAARSGKPIPNRRDPDLATIDFRSKKLQGRGVYPF
jgi:hypothetical protein